MMILVVIGTVVLYTILIVIYCGTDIEEEGWLGVLVSHILRN